MRNVALGTDCLPSSLAFFFMGKRKLSDFPCDIVFGKAVLIGAR
jgi:hypothetical protein